ncbi:MAG: tRNA guanosine(34) transglycosylase Tgt [Saprospiraceae bacterium]|nr:tRNA guanosine(34) transglycosylase Tgt [Saprospiraceae bacterium]
MSDAFQLEHTDSGSSARAGVLTTAHGQIQTPIFMPVGTAATVKGVPADILRDPIGAQIILSNTYHLMLRPGEDIIAAAGGIHAFMQWDRPVLTDSGGYQVYSLSKMRKITEDGVSFQSHIDGASYRLRPEDAIRVQQDIGADIIMAFDECTPYPCDRAYAEKSMRLTHQWLDRCCAWFADHGPRHGYEQILSPIVQGSTFADLRTVSAEYIAGKEMPINAIGGLSVGEPHDEMYAMTDVVCRILPADRPRYLMGVGTPENLLECIALSVDMFDCVLPSRNARHGLLYTRSGVINIKNEKWKRDFSPLDPDSPGWGGIYSRAYVRHLVLSGEMLGGMICSVHNLAFYLELVREARHHILQNTFSAWKRDVSKSLSVRL